MATLKDVAKLAGVSPSTVSRTLSKRIFVEEETRARVLKAVEELHYQPSAMARALKEGKTHTLALLIPDINSLFYPEIMHSMEKYASEQGYTIMLCNTNNQLEKEKRVAGLVCGRGVDGILCMSVADDVSHLAALQKEYRIPTILVNRHASETMGSVTIDNEHGGYLMTKHLLDNGHRNIACMLGNLDHERFRSRYNGCKRAFEETGITNYKRYCCYDIDSLDEAYQKTREMLSMPDPPTAFFATMDILTLGIYSGIVESGYRIPDDISIVGFDDIFITAYMMPPLTTYHASIDELARRSVQLLLKKIHNPGLEAEEITIQGTLKERKSVKSLADDGS